MRRLASAGTLLAVSLTFAMPAEAGDCRAPGAHARASAPAKAGCPSRPGSLREEAEAVQAGETRNSFDLGGWDVRVTGRVRADATVRAR